MICKNLSINENNHLTLGGIDTVEMAKKYGTPLYLFDEDRIRERCRTYVCAMKEAFGDDALPLYASKAASFKQMYRIVMEEGMGTDLVSSGELYTAASVGFPLEKAYFTAITRPILTSPTRSMKRSGTSWSITSRSLMR